MSRTLTDRFWSKVDRSDPSGCWPWMAARKPKGYGVFSRGTRADGLVTSSRMAWELVNGAIPDGLLVRHACDNPPCCNPEHLCLGTDSENLADAYQRGRRPLRLNRSKTT